MAQVRSMRGEIVDFNALQQAHATKVALGNANMNAKGDKVNPNGIVLKTQEQIEAEWAAQQAKNTASVNFDIKGAVPKELKKALDLQDQNFEPVATQVNATTEPKTETKVENKPTAKSEKAEAPK